MQRNRNYPLILNSLDRKTSNISLICNSVVESGDNYIIENDEEQFMILISLFVQNIE